MTEEIKEEVPVIEQAEEKPKKKPGRKKKPSVHAAPEPRDQKVSEALTSKSYASLEDLDDMPLDTHEDYKAYNEAVRRRRRVLRKKDVDFLYAPIEVLNCIKCRITRTRNRGQPIKINRKYLKEAIWFQSPRGGFKDGEEVMVPDCMVDIINGFAEPKYKQVLYPDGSHETVLDYMDNKYSCQIMPG